MSKLDDINYIMELAAMLGENLDISGFIPMENKFEKIGRECGKYSDPQGLDYITGKCGDCMDGFEYWKTNKGKFKPMTEIKEVPPLNLENKFEKIGREIGKLVGEKNLAYGDSFGRSGECLRQMYPNGVRPDQFDELLTIARVLDKLFRIATDKDAFGENPWKDIAGYSILGIDRATPEKDKK